MALFKSFAVLLTLIIISCCSGQKTASEDSPDETNNDITMNTQKMMEAGFKQASIVASEEQSECPFIMKMAGSDSDLLDPINLDEKYMKDGGKIWVKYTSLRMQNRCDKARPVKIEEIQKRAE
jgi:type III secretory pathway component EscV